jgi:hypothetical protein
MDKNANGKRPAAPVEAPPPPWGDADCVARVPAEELQRYAEKWRKNEPQAR